MSAPKIFISYSHDSPDHKEWVKKLGTDLRSNGIDVTLDQWDLSLGQDLSLFMQNGILRSDRVLLICTPSYVQKAENGIGGVGYERLIVTAEMVQAIDTIKFVPVARDNFTDNIVPRFLGPRLYSDFRNDDVYKDKLQELLEQLHGYAGSSKPPLGPSPFRSTPAHVLDPAAPDRKSATTGEVQNLEDTWFSKHSAKGQQGIAALGLLAHMELRLSSTHRVTKSQLELLEAVKGAEIRTFGWPIGITLENREEFRPRPYGDGIAAEIAIGEDSRDRNSYDYWVSNAYGDFFLLQSLFEDSRPEIRAPHNAIKRIFFDTRMVRVTESLMFAERFYQKLDAPKDAQISVSVSHRGLKGRQLDSASPRRAILGRTSVEDVVMSQVTTSLGLMKERRVSSVYALLAPLFMLFDFQAFEMSVYHEIVTNFENGKIQ